MVQNTKLTKMIFWAMMVAVGVVISPLLRIEGMCPMAHFINVTCAVLLGPWYAFLCALAIGLIRMAFMGIPPLALTGAVFGAALSGILYRASKGKIIFYFYVVCMPFLFCYSYLTSRSCMFSMSKILARKSSFDKYTKIIVRYRYYL